MMKSNLYKLTKVDDEIIDLYIECFKKDKIFTSRDKNIIKDAIEEEDWATLEGMLNSKSIKDFPDLIKMIEEALKGRK